MQSVNYDLITCAHKSFASEFSWTPQPVIHLLLGQDDQDRHNFWCLKLINYWLSQNDQIFNSIAGARWLRSSQPLMPEKTGGNLWRRRELFKRYWTAFGLKLLEDWNQTKRNISGCRHTSSKKHQVIQRLHVTYNIYHIKNISHQEQKRSANPVGASRDEEEHWLPSKHDRPVLSRLVFDFRSFSMEITKKKVSWTCPCSWCK